LPENYLHNEKELHLRVAEGDVKAFSEIFYHYQHRLYPFLLKRTKDPEIATEILQNIFLKLWVNRERLAKMENPEGYIYKMAANQIFDYFRELATEQRLKNLHAIGKNSDRSTEEAVDLRETQRIISEAVELLPAQRKLIYKLRQEGLRYDEISAELGLSVNTIKNQLILAAKFVRSYLTARGISTLVLLSFYTRL
jgi:RNA polymerase sigma-70 factor (family 1)